MLRKSQTSYFFHREEEFERFNKWIDQNTPNIRKIRNQITFEEYIRLTEKI